MKVSTVIRLSLLVLFLAAPRQLIANGAASNATTFIQFQYLDDGGTPLVEMSRNDSVVRATRIVLSEGDEVIVVGAGEGVLELLVGEHRITARKLSLFTDLNKAKMEGASRVNILRRGKVCEVAPRDERPLVNDAIAAATRALADELLSNHEYGAAIQVAESLTPLAAADADDLRQHCMQTMVDDFNKLLESADYHACLAMAQQVSKQLPTSPVVADMLRKARLGCKIRERKPDDAGIRLLASRSKL